MKQSGDNKIFEITPANFASINDLGKIGLASGKPSKKTGKAQSGEKSAFGIMIAMLVLVGLMIGAVSFHKASQFIGNSRFTTTLRKIVAAFEQHTVLHGSFPPMAAPGVMPPGMEDMLNKVPWTQKTPLGGQWDWVTNAPGPARGIRLYMPSVSEKRMKTIDESIDDGNLNLGRLRILDDNTGYLYTIE